MLNNGERQVSTTIDGIRPDHVARYKWALDIIPNGSKVIDFACGVGYGCKILADGGNWPNGYDICEEAIEYAKQHYSTLPGGFYVADGANPPDLGEADAAVCFETIEHIADPRPLLRALHKAAPTLICSVPNEDKLPWMNQEGATTKFHYRHYTRKQFRELLSECGWSIDGEYGQAGRTENVEPTLGEDGLTLIAVCHRAEGVPENKIEAEEEVDQPKELHIAILGLGPSLDQYLEITKRVGGRSKFCDQTWAINALGDVFACDLIFHMDDIRIQEIRAKAKPQSNIAAMVEWIKNSKVPVVTSRAHEDYPALVEYPLEDVLNHLGHDYFNNTAAYAVAFAIHVGATKLSLFGMDYTYPNVHDAEKGRACVEFWLGQAHARGVEISLPATTTLMDSMYPRASRLYGYDTLDIDFNVQKDGVLKLGFTPRGKLPTADEIERNYDHSAPIKDQHLGTKG